jgi:hypothetical protein
MVLFCALARRQQSVTLTFRVTPSRHLDPNRLTRWLSDEVVILVGSWDEDPVLEAEVARARQFFPETAILYRLFGTLPKEHDRAFRAPVARQAIAYVSSLASRRIQ